MSYSEWSRLVLATEIVFASEVLGSGWDRSIATGMSDAASIRMLREVQRKAPVRRGAA